MKATLVFNLDEHEDRLAHLRAIKATDAYLAIYTLSQDIRTRLKYAELSPERQDELENTQNMLIAAMDRYSIDLDKELE